MCYAERNLPGHFTKMARERHPWRESEIIVGFEGEKMKGFSVPQQKRHQTSEDKCFNKKRSMS